MDESPTEAERTGRARLPTRGFMYTLDQVADLLNVEIASLRHHIVFMGQDVKGKQPEGGMKAYNIMPSRLHEKPEWRVPESEVVRYLRSLGLVVYERTYRAK